MIKCMQEQILERAAMELLAAGIEVPEAFEAIVGESGSPLEPELLELLRHCRTCRRCRELLALFMATEAGLREALADRDARTATEDAEGHSARPRILRLIRMGADSRSDALGELRHSLPYAVAADSPGAGEKASSMEDMPVLSLTSEDGSYIVRVFPKASGEGATAILIRGQAERGEGVACSTPTAQVQFSIQVEGQEYPFDEKGVATLPRFPVQSVRIVVR